MLSRIALIGIASLAFAIQAQAQEPGERPRVPIVIGGNYDWDACGGTGVVEGLDPAGDGFLAVRSGPGTKYAEIDRLYNGEELYICDQKGKWIGVVYTRRGQNCDVMSPWPARQAYTGPCKSGWAHQNWIRLIAG